MAGINIQSYNNSSIISYNLLENCEIMLDYIIDSGMKVPDKIGDSLSEISLKAAPHRIDMYEQLEKASALPEFNGVQRFFNPNENLIPINVELECKMKIGNAIKADVPELQKIYSLLTLIIYPATPHSIVYTNPTEKMFFFWGPKCAHIIRNMWILSFLFLVGFVASQIESVMIAAPDNWDKYREQLTLVCGAGLGALIYSIYIANKYIVKRTFQAKYVGLYSIRIVLGIISGFIIANISNAYHIAGTNGNLAYLTPIMLSLFGGFSADAIMKISVRVVAMFSTLVEGDSKDILENKLAGQKARLQEKLLRQKLNNVNELIPVISELQGKADEDTIQRLTDLINKILENDTPLMQEM